MTPRFVFDDRHASAVTETYMKTIAEATRMAGFSVANAKDVRPRRGDYLVTNEVLVTLRYMLRGYKRHVVWIQGIVPEESYMRRHSRLRRTVLSCIERYVLRRAKFLLFVSPEMRTHYEKKYGSSLVEKSFIMPCFSETAISPSAFGAEKEPRTFAYVGSLSAWQCFEETAAFYAAYERASGENAKFYVFTGEAERAHQILESVGARHYAISYREGEALDEALARVQYGFVLRHDDEVNRVATPVKLSVYAANGLIPLYSPVLSDFARHANRLDYGIAVPAGAPTAELLERLTHPYDAMAVRQKCEALFREYYNTELYREKMAAHFTAIGGGVRRTSEKLRLLFVVNHLRTGGISRALRDLLRVIGDEYDVTLLVADGAEDSSLPKNIKRIEPDAFLRATETPRAEIGALPFSAAMFRVFGAAFAKIFGKVLPFWLVCRCFYRKMGDFDVAIAFCQPSPPRSFCNITNELALACRARRRVTFLHGDFALYGGNSAANRRLYRKFDHICAVSDGTAERFLSVMPELAPRVSVVPNLVDAPRILSLSEEAVSFDNTDRPVIVSVCRLAPEKGLLRCVPIFRALRERGLLFSWHLIGDGPLQEEMEDAVRQNGLCDCVFLHGERANPYPYMARADFLLLPSFHEAAPLVLSEAAVLGLPVLATDTCSARAMVASGIVCGMDDDSFAEALERFLTDASLWRNASTDREAVLHLWNERNQTALDAFRRAVTGKTKYEGQENRNVELF